jgi:hypothetical protein
MALFGAKALKAALDKKDDATTNPASAISATSAPQITPALRKIVYERMDLKALQNKATPLDPALQAKLEQLGILRRLR